LAGDLKIDIGWTSVRQVQSSDGREDVRQVEIERASIQPKGRRQLTL
jgi:hypothetical protein